MEEPESWKELLDDLDIDEYELIKKIKKARRSSERLDEIEVVLDSGKSVKIKLNHTNPEGIMGKDVGTW